MSGTLNEAQHAYLERIRGRHLLTLIEGALDFAAARGARDAGRAHPHAV